MPGRFPLLVVLLTVAALITATSGCATVSEERMAMLESAVMDLQARDIRLATLEDTVAALVAKNPPVASGTSPEPVRDLQTQPGPRRVSPDTAPIKTPPSAQPAPAQAQAVPASPASVPAQPVTAAPAQPVAPPAAQTASPAAPQPAPVKRGNPAQAAQRYQAALTALESGRPQAALGQFCDFLAAYPGHELAPNAGYWLGECHYTMKQYDAAVSAFKDVVAQYPAHAKAAAAMLKAGFSYAQMGDASNARFYLEALVRDFPSSQPAFLARARLAAL